MHYIQARHFVYLSYTFSMKSKHLDLGLVFANMPILKLLSPPLFRLLRVRAPYNIAHPIQKKSTDIPKCFTYRPFPPEPTARMHRSWKKVNIHGGKDLCTKNANLSEDRCALSHNNPPLPSQRKTLREPPS
jgi:hypothetical protein